MNKSPTLIVRLETDPIVPAVAEETLMAVASALRIDPGRVFALARKIPKKLVPDDELDLAVYRKVKAMSRNAKRRFFAGGARPDKK